MYRQFERVKKAHTIGTPSTDDFKAAIWMDTIHNNPVTLQNKNLAKNLFGPDIESLEGKSIGTKPIPVVSDYVEVPMELYVIFCIDGLKIKRFSFLAHYHRTSDTGQIKDL